MKNGIIKNFTRYIGALIAELHQKEKEALFDFINEHTFKITTAPENFKKLSQGTQKSIIETKERLHSQTTAAGMMSLFEDSYFLKKGFDIRDELRANNLPAFEDVMESVRQFYYFGKK